MLAAGDLRASFVPAAGMIGYSLTHRGEELLVQRGGLGRLARHAASRSACRCCTRGPTGCATGATPPPGARCTIDRTRGIVRADEHGLPIHGALAAAEDWDVIDAGADADAAWLTAALDYGRRDDRLAVFPFPHTLELELRLEGDALAVTTTVAADRRRRGPARVRLASVAVASRRAARRVGARAAGSAPRSRSTPATCRPASGRMRGAEREPLGDRVLDDHFAVAEDAHFAVAGGGREIAVEWAGGYRFAQVFAPDGARRRVPGADDGAGRGALDGRGPRAAPQPRRARERDVPRARHLATAAGYVMM